MKIIVLGLLFLCALIYAECKQNIEHCERGDYGCKVEAYCGCLWFNDIWMGATVWKKTDQNGGWKDGWFTPCNIPSQEASYTNNTCDNYRRGETIQLEYIQPLTNPAISNENENDADDEDIEINSKVMADSKKSSRRRTRRSSKSRSRRKRRVSTKKICLDDANMYRRWHPGTRSLKWDSGLARAAKKWANYMLSIKTMKHDKNRGAVGENLYTKNAWGDGVTLSSDGTYCKNANRDWYNEIADYSYSTQSSKNGKQIGHFTQMVWKGSTKVGYGIAKQKRGNQMYVYVAARYSPPGNVAGRYASNVGPQNKGKDEEVENLLEEEIVEDAAFKKHSNMGKSSKNLIVTNNLHVTTVNSNVQHI